MRLKNSPAANVVAPNSPAALRPASEHSKERKSKSPAGVEARLAGIDFDRLGFAPDVRKDAFLAALRGLHDFQARGFSFNRMCDKINSLFQYAGDSRKIIQFWIHHSVCKLAENPAGIVRGDVLGIAGEISGIYEAIFKQKTTLAGIKLGRFAEIEMMVLDEEGMGVKEFDAVSTEEREGNRDIIVTVFEFKFTLSLRKLYEQVIGMDSAKLPHLVILTRFKQFEQVRNLVYFGEVGDGYMTQAIGQFISKNAGIAGRMSIRGKGYSIKFSLPEIGEFLCDHNTICLARHIGVPFMPKDPDSSEYKKKIRQMRTIIDRKMEQERCKPNAKFDVIIAVSNAPKKQLAGIKKLVGIPAA